MKRDPDPPSDWSPASAVTALSELLGDGVTGSVTPPLPALGHSWLAAAPAHLASWIRGGLRVDETTIGRVERHADLLRTLDRRLSGDTVARAATAQLRLIAALLAEGSFTAGVARRLFLAVADLTHLASWAAFDAARSEAAQRHHRAGLYAAHAAGDRTFAGYLLICLAYQALRDGDPADALLVADLAVEGVHGTSSRRAQALIAGHQRVIRSAAGRSGGPPHDLSPAQHDPHWAHWFDQPALSARYYPFGEGAGARLAGRWPSAPDPQPPGWARRLHRLAEQLAADPDSAAGVQEALDALRHPAA